MENIINNFFNFLDNIISKFTIGKVEQSNGQKTMSLKVVYDFIEQEEGRRLKVYKCPAGALTIGVGHNIDSNGLPPHITTYFAKHREITNEMADELLKEDVKVSLDICKKIYGEELFKSLSIPRKTALVSFAFQLGETRLRKFKNTNEHIRNKNWDMVAKHLRLSLIYKQTPKRIKRMINILLEDKF